MHVCVEVRDQFQHCSLNSVHLVGLGFLLFFKIIFVCGMCLCVCLQWPEEGGVESPRTRVAGNFEDQCGFWELNLGPLQEQQVIFTTEQSSQTHLVW